MAENIFFLRPPPFLVIFFFLFKEYSTPLFQITIDAWPRNGELHLAAAACQLEAVEERELLAVVAVVAVVVVGLGSIRNALQNKMNSTYYSICGRTY